MNLKEKVLVAFGWSVGSKLTGQLITWLLTIIIIRLLTPTDYGLLAMAMIFISFLDIFSDMGMGSAIIQAQKINADFLRKIHGIIIIVNFSLYMFLFLVAPLIAAFFEESRLTEIVRFISLKFIFLIFTTVPHSLLDRELDFKNRSIMLMICTVLSSISIFILAWNGMGVWSLVYGSVLSTFLQMVGINIIKPYFKLPSFDFSGMRRHIYFGSSISLERALSYIQSQSDILIVGKFLGKEILGYYSLSMHLSSLPMQKLMGTINQIALPAYASIQDESEKIVYYFLKVIRITSFFAFPVFFGLSSVSQEFVATLLGDQWELAILPIQILCLIMPFRMIGNLLPVVLRGVGRPEVTVTNNLISTSIMIISFILGSHWGLIGICMAWVIFYPFVFYILVVRTGKIINVTFKQVLSSLYSSLIISTIMYISVWLMSEFIPSSWESFIRLLILITTGMGTFFLTTVVFNKQNGIEALSMTKFGNKR